MTESPIIDKFTADFSYVFGTRAGHFSHGCEVQQRDDIPQWKKNRSNARSMGRKTFMHTTPCRSCSGLVRLTHKCYEGTKINVCAGCE